MSFDLSKVPNWFDYGDLYSEVCREHLSKINRPVRCLEVGAFFGRSTIHLAQEVARYCQYGSVVVTIDHCRGSQTEREHQWLAYAAGGNYATPLLRTIHESRYSEIIVPVLCSFQTFHDTFTLDGYDFIFIDAGHTYDEVRRDLLFAQDLLILNDTDPCIFAGHDYNGNWPTVKSAVDDHFIHQLVPGAVQHLPDLTQGLQHLNANRGSCWSVIFPPKKSINPNLGLL